MFKDNAKIKIKDSAYFVPTLDTGKPSLQELRNNQTRGIIQNKNRDLYLVKFPDRLAYLYEHEIVEVRD